MSLRPTDIDANKTKKELTLTWSDGHISTYSFSLLRAACPCAECRGGHDNMGGDPDPEVFENSHHRYRKNTPKRCRCDRFLRDFYSLGRWS